LKAIDRLRVRVQARSIRSPLSSDPAPKCRKAAFACAECRHDRGCRPCPQAACTRQRIPKALVLLENWNGVP